MPHIFKEVCYRKHHDLGKCKVGDTVFLKSRTDVAMTVSYWDEFCNKKAGHRPIIKVKYLDKNFIPQVAEFFADELTL